MCTGIFVAHCCLPASFHDRDAAAALALSVNGGVVLSDLGYVSAPHAENMAYEAGLLLITPKDGGRVHEKPRIPISSLRRLSSEFFTAKNAES